MRLTHLKLAGFKSFVDPTTLLIHGQRVGVVGPNGCGKSNVMESVRWVLGESSAKEMRADAMDAVIFNGSGNRKPISRASVELIFDNSLGGANGEWSQYAEISVKRVIERDKGSSYFINNTAVRRRDVADLFLGTGLGGRAYAIIGQNTISRIVEAKPEEMRVFLEEAAGITKYKERRRETELRLKDTRENLTRVEDILRELDKQILRLESQAQVANEYHRLLDALALTKGQIWLLRKQEASIAWEKAKLAVEKLVIELEAQTADLRSNEHALETCRQAHIAATEEVNAAQAAYYEANAAVSNLENQVKHTADARERLQHQLEQLQSQQEKNAAQQASVEHALLEGRHHLETAKTELSAAETQLHSAQNDLDTSTKKYEATLQAYNLSQARWLELEQKKRLEHAEIDHIARAINETAAQLKRLQHDLSTLQMPSPEMLIEKQHQLSVLESDISTAEAQGADTHTREASIQAQLKEVREQMHEQQRHLHMVEAEISSLSRIQQSMREANNEGALAAWLKNSGLNAETRIWQCMTIQSGWETALEAALGNRLNALVNQRLPNTRPPAGLSIVIGETVQETTRGSSAFTPMHSIIERADAACAAALHDWLNGVYLLTDDIDPLAAIQQLKGGECLVAQNGDIYTRSSVTYFGAQSLVHGVLERQAKLDGLQLQQPQLQQVLTNTHQLLQSLEVQLQALRTEQHQKQQHLKLLTQQMHTLSLNVQQLLQQQSNAIQRKTQLEADLQTAAQKLAKLQSDSVLKEKHLHEMSVQLAQIHLEKSGYESEKHDAEQALSAARDQLHHQARDQQEKTFNIKLIENNINELESKVQLLYEEKTSLNMRCGEVVSTLEATKMEALKANLEAALNVKQQHESALAYARNALAQSQEMLMQQERLRLQQEQMLHPLRDKLETSRLNEQESRLHFEQCQSELASYSIEESILAKHLQQEQPERLKISQLEHRRTGLESQIEALGAVNLAAIEELASEKNRKQYLDSQCSDLINASQTLEDAIRKIDRETRNRLQATFDQANIHFNELFTTLFGGGQARLVMLGDEILDTGMQVFAQPPGKKNSTIHLLSGGEKALTALALVFALFRLNPAPFCLMDEVDAPLDDSNTERFCAMVKKMSEKTQFLYVSHNKITMEMAQQLIGVTMQESGVSRIVDVDMEAAVKMAEA